MKLTKILTAIENTSYLSHTLNVVHNQQLNNVLINNNSEEIISKIINGKGFYQTRFQNLTDSELENLLLNSIKKLDIDITNKNELIFKLNTDKKFLKENINLFKNKSIENIISYKKEFNKEVKNNKLRIKKERIKIDSDKNYYINEGSEYDSKIIYAEINKLKEEYSTIYNNIIQYQEDLLKIEEISKILNSIQIALGLAQAALYIVSIFTGGTTGILGGLLTTASIFIGLYQKYQLYQKAKLEIILKEFNDKNYVHNMLTNSFFYNIFTKNLESLFPKKLQSHFSGISNIISIGFSSDSLWNDIQSIRNRSKIIFDFYEKVNLNHKRLLNLKSITKFVVVNETEQYGEYNQGGFGGRNLIFKNIHTDEEYTLNELLNKDYLFLYYNNLTVVNDKTKGKYIRTLPNYSLKDNLN
ncbi:hypothetical protein RRG49_01185 [Mycoplasmopsis felis]|uniref:hypothetical protein n=1 Tax=Mycoplasmopsis felis TaxID=33923 RepID=UPI0021AEE9F1|nr:hypothetical protein [Mycoplasmopsis felis]UWW01295.1 hypothetical protein NW064_02830 [Mycoplasmopsis felis]WQQ09605.1 hypothetical protein RRG41_01555 [Mycoplasmopsis felis]